MVSAKEMKFHVQAEYVMNDSDSRQLATERVTNLLRYKASEKAGSFVSTVSEYDSEKGYRETFQNVTSALVKLKNIKQRLQVNNNVITIRASAIAVVVEEDAQSTAKRILADSSGAYLKKLGELEAERDKLSGMIRSIERGDVSIPASDLAGLVSRFLETRSSVLNYIDASEASAMSTKQYAMHETRLQDIKASFTEHFKNANVSVGILDTKPVLGGGAEVTLDIDWDYFVWNIEIDNFFSEFEYPGHKRNNFYIRQKDQQPKEMLGYDFMAQSFIAIEVSFGDVKRYIPLVYKNGYNRHIGCNIHQNHVRDDYELSDWIRHHSFARDNSSVCMAREGMHLLMKNRKDKSVSFSIPASAVGQPVSASIFIRTPR